MPNPETKPLRAPVWKSTAVSNLYLHTPSGRYYARMTINGKPTWRTLKTSVFTVAKIKMASIAGNVAKAKLAAPGTTRTSSEVRTMGDLERVFLARLETGSRSAGTKRNWQNWMKRIVANWPNGSFHSTLPNQVYLDTVLQLRTALTRCVFPLRKSQKTRKGYSAEVINQTLSVLRILLQIAKEHHLIFSSPFDEQTAFGAKISLPVKPKPLNLPSRFDMERVFADITALDRLEGLDQNQIAYIREQLQNASEHARFLAFSGGRISECNRATWEDVGPEQIMLYGTKSRTSERPVPIVPAMRALLDEMRTRRIAMGLPLRGPILRVGSCKHALTRACARVGVRRLTPHKLRHYFITVCVESGVDIPTVSRWVGHADGGALLMETYAHLRDQHSIRMGAQVNFGTTTNETTPQSSSGAQSIRE